MVDADTLSRFFLAIYFLLIGVHYTHVALGRAARSRQSHINSGAPRSSAWWVRQTFNFFRSFILILCVARLFLPVDGLLLRFDALYQLPVVASGVGLMLVSLGIISYVHAYMGDQWRSGIDTNSATLLTDGPYQRSRNPMFIGIILGQLGFFLALPSAFTLLCLIAGASALVVQSKNEEDALAQLFGEQYRRYQAQVPRWF